MTFLHHPKSCAVVGIFGVHDIYQLRPTADHEASLPPRNALSTRVIAILHGFGGKIDDARVYGTVLWSVRDEMRPQLWLSIPIHSIAIYHRVEETTKNDLIARYYPNAEGPTLNLYRIENILENLQQKSNKTVRHSCQPKIEISDIHSKRAKRSKLRSWHRFYTDCWSTDGNYVFNKSHLIYRFYSLFSTYKRQICQNFKLKCSKCPFWCFKNIYVPFQSTQFSNL